MHSAGEEWGGGRCGRGGGEGGGEGGGGGRRDIVLFLLRNSA